MYETVDELWEDLIKHGIIYANGVDEDGQPLYQWADDEYCNNVNPFFLEVKQSVIKDYLLDLEETLIALYLEGVVNFDINDEGELVWFLVNKDEDISV